MVPERSLDKLTQMLRVAREEIEGGVEVIAYGIPGVLPRFGGNIVFSRDYEFGPPSTAGGMVRGGNTSGLIQWKDQSGRTLKEIDGQ